MTYATDTIDRRDRAQAAVEELPRQSVWMETNLAWNPDFWQGLTAKTLMRLNPHWHLEKPQGGTFPVEDVLVEAQCATAPELSSDGKTFRARFPEIGLTILARSCGGGENTDLRFEIDSVENGCMSAEELRRTMQYWLPSIREYYRLHEANSIKHRFWRLIMNKVILTMNPAQRRICGFMFKLTVLECLLIVVLGVGWFYYGA